MLITKCMHKYLMKIEHKYLLLLLLLMFVTNIHIICRLFIKLMFPDLCDKICSKIKIKVVN